MYYVEPFMKYFASILHSQLKSSLRIRLLALLTFVCLILAVASVAIGIVVHKHDKQFSLPRVIPISSRDGEYHRFATPSLLQKTVTWVRNGGELGYVQMPLEVMKRLGVHRHRREDIGYEDRLYGFPFPFAGYSFRYDRNATLVDGGTLYPSFWQVRINRFVISIPELAASCVMYFMVLFGMLFAFQLWQTTRYYRGRCAKCKYSFAGLPDSLEPCPECGLCARKAGSSLCVPNTLSVR